MVSSDMPADSKLRRLYDAGVKAFQAGHTKKAIKRFEQAREEAVGMPLQGFINVLLAACYMRLGDVFGFEKAKMEAGRVLSELTAQGQDEIAASLRGFIEDLYQDYPPSGGGDLSAQSLFVEAGIGLHMQEAARFFEAGLFPAALASFSLARDRAHERADLTAEATALTNMGTVSEQMNKWDQAVEYLQTALAIQERIGDRRGQARSLWSLGRTRDCQRRFGEASEYSQRAADLAHEVGDRECEGGALNNLGNVARALGKFEDAARHYEASLAIRQALDNPGATAITLSNLGGMYQNLGRQRDATRCLEDAIPMHHYAADYSGEALAMGNLAMVLSNGGRPEEALRLLERARHIGQELQDPQVLGVIDNDLGTVYRTLGLFDQAIELHRMARENARKRGDRHGEGGAANNLGIDYQTSGVPQSAMEWYKKAADIAEELGTPTVAATSLSNFATVAIEGGAYDAAFNAARRAASLAKSMSDPYRESAALGALGMAEVQLDLAPAALAHFEEALRISRELGTELPEVSHLTNLAQTERLLGQVGDALGHYAEAMEVLESQRTGIFNDELRVTFLSTASAVAVHYADLLVAQGKLAEALHVVERGKARSLLELLAESQGQIGVGIDAELVRSETGLLEEMQDVDRRLNYLRSSGEGRAAEIQALQEREQQLDLELMRIRSDIRRQNPRFAALVQPEPWTVDQIQRELLDPETVLLEYLLGEERGLVFAVAADGIRAMNLPPRKNIEELVERLRDHVVSGRKGPIAYTHELYRMLVEPVADLIKDRDLLIVPDGPLYLLPFALLTAESANEKEPGPIKYLIRDHAMSYAPSASVAGLLMRDETAAQVGHILQLAAYGDPVSEELQLADSGLAATADEAMATRIRQACPRIPFTSNEVWEVADLIADDALPLEQPEIFEGSTVRLRTGCAATKQDIVALLAKGPSCRFLHLATHGIMDARRPQFSGLLFSGPLEDPGRVIWQTFEILNSHIHSELVVLSACDTGLGRLFNGEGVVGLSRAFLCAGAEAVCVSLWRVADASTPELMRVFYDQVLVGMPKRRALQAAQLEMLNRPQTRPSQWAPFVLFGAAGRAPMANRGGA
jgi:CHAT domain-containing protein/tetratricopeptide (TPR) repeat protein